MSGFRFTIDRRALARAEVLDAAIGGLSDGAEHLLEHANRTVPIEEGTLMRSGTTKVKRGPRPQAAVGYDTPYAVRQHEDTRLRHDEGRRAKWLEASLKERALPIKAMVAQRIREAFR